jgi:hypothetical protein
MGKGTEGLQKMREEFEAENEGIVIPTQVWWLVNPQTIRERRQNGEIAASSVVFVIKGSQVAQSVVKKGINISKLYFGLSKPSEVSERMWSVNLDASIPGEYQTIRGHSGRPSE